LRALLAIDFAEESVRSRFFSATMPPDEKNLGAPNLSALRPADEERTIELLFVDDDVVVANKPSGLLVHRGWDRDDDVALFRVRDAVGAEVHPVHRLDRGTSGALVFARTAAAAAALGRAFAEGRVEKRYLALVRGTPPDAGVIDHAIPPKEDSQERVRAVTRFRLIARSPVERCSLVEAMP
jgi:tRNA pseudouridine65 synthase